MNKANPLNVAFLNDMLANLDDTNPDYNKIMGVFDRFAIPMDNIYMASAVDVDDAADELRGLGY